MNDGIENDAGLAIDQIVVTANAEMRTARARLEVEENGREVASLQGKVAGYKRLIGHMAAEFGLTEFAIEDLGDAPIRVPDMADPTLEALSAGIALLLLDPRWAAVLARIEAHVEEMKTRLLFEAEKSRDLDLCQGQYKGETVYRNLFDAVKWETEKRANKREDARKNPQLFAEGTPA